MSKPRRAHGAERCTVRNPGPHGARCRYQAGHDPVDDGVNGHAPELDDVTKADGSPVDFAPVGPIELRAALREERAARLKAEAERDRAESHAKRAEDVAHGLATQTLILRSLFVNLRWDGPQWIKPHEKRAMDEATRLAGGKALDS